MSTAITTLGAPSMTETRKSIDQMVAQRDAIVEAMHKVMRDGIDFGIIPGTPKPTLYKPGSEKILSMFHLAATPTVEDLSAPDCLRYRVTITITHAPTGAFLGQGIGEASSAESKYQWRASVCAEEWEETPADRRRAKWKKGDRTPYQIKQVRAEMDDVANTVLKMAKKRAQIDAVLTVTAASDIFAQDLADLKANGFDVDPEDPPADSGELKRREAVPAPAASAPAAKAADLPTSSSAPPKGGATITPQQGKRFWAVAMGRVNDYKVVMAYLREVHGVNSKDLILWERWDEAMHWAEKGDEAQ